MAPTEANHTPEPAKPPPRLSAGLSGGLAQILRGLEAFHLRLANGLLGPFRGRVDGVLAQIEGGGGQALLDAVLDGRTDLGHAVETLSDDRIELFRFLAIQAGALELVDLAADEGDFIGQDLERIFDAAHASPAPALCALASSSANSPSISF